MTDTPNDRTFQADEGWVQATEGAGVTVHVSVADVAAIALAESFSVTATSKFAEEWFKDARNEAELSSAGDIHARRREIIFSATCLESYIVEWSVDVLSSKLRGTQLYDAVKDYFAVLTPVMLNKALSGTHATLEEARQLIQSGDIARAMESLETGLKEFDPSRQTNIQDASGVWSRVPRRLFDEGYLPKRLGKYGRANNRDFFKLIQLRNGVTHADLSRPEVRSSDDVSNRSARVTTTMLVDLAPGWAISVARERIRQLHHGTETDEPRWIVGR